MGVVFGPQLWSHPCQPVASLLGARMHVRAVLLEFMGTQASITKPAHGVPGARLLLPWAPSLLGEV